jgi:hypothetical protein
MQFLLDFLKTRQSPFFPFFLQSGKLDEAKLYDFVESRVYIVRVLSFC